MPYKGRIRALSFLFHRPGPASLLDFQKKQLLRIVRHAYATVPFYRELYDSAGFHPSQLRGLEDLYRIPVCDKTEMLRVAPLALLSTQRPARLMTRRTSGSTGRPFTIHCSWLEDRYLAALRFQKVPVQRRGLGRRVSRLRVGTQARPPAIVQIAARLGFANIQAIDSRLTAEEILERLQQGKPDLLTGYSNVTCLVAALAQKKGIQIRPRLVMVGGETLTAGMRRTIQESFKCPVRDVYSSSEFVLIAAECPESGDLHVCEEGVILEVLKQGQPAPPGENGEAVITALHSFTQPFIRFCLGDEVTRGVTPCRGCGRPYSTIRAVSGRLCDRIILPGRGAASVDEIFSYLDETHSWVGQYQLIQEKDASVVLKVVPRRAPTPVENEAVLHRLRRFAGPGVESSMVLVSSIEPTPGQKFRLSKSAVHSHYEEATSSESRKG